MSEGASITTGWAIAPLVCMLKEALENLIFQIIDDVNILQRQHLAMIDASSSLLYGKAVQPFFKVGLFQT